MLKFRDHNLFRVTLKYTCLTLYNARTNERINWPQEDRPLNSIYLVNMALIDSLRKSTL